MERGWGYSHNTGRCSETGFLVLLRQKVSAGADAIFSDVTESILVRQSFGRVVVELAKALVPALISLATLYVITVYFRQQDFTQIYVALASVATALCLLLLNPRRFRSESQLSPDRSSIIASTLGRWGVLVGILFAIAYVTGYSEDFSRIIIVSWIVATPVLVVIADLALYAIAYRLQIAQPHDRTAVFAGCNEVSQQLAVRVEKARELKIYVAGFFDDRSADRLGLSASLKGEPPRLLGKLPDLVDYVKTHGVDMIFVALPMRHIQRVIDLLDQLRDTTASVYYLPDIFVYDLIQSRSGELLGMPVITMCETPFYGHRGVIKRTTDIVIAGLALIGLLPLLLLLAVLVATTSPGPVIFRQRRYGLDGAEITVYKFRSMTVTEDGSEIIQARPGDSRLTRVGGFLRRTSLDELPQLVNVLQGRMSLVGPRPHAVAHNEQYRKLIKGYMIRHKVRPGITGLAQVNGCRGETERLEEMQARIAYDIDYLRHWSLMLDLKILWRTFLMMFRRQQKAY